MHRSALLSHSFSEGYFAILCAQATHARSRRSSAYGFLAPNLGPRERERERERENVAFWLERRALHVQ